MSYWGDQAAKLWNEPRLMPNPTIPQQPPAAKAPKTMAEYIAAARADLDPLNEAQPLRADQRFSPGQDVIHVPTRRADRQNWDTNNQRNGDAGELFSATPQELGAAHQAAVRDGRFNTSGTSAQTNAATVAELMADGAWDTPRGELG